MGRPRSGVFLAKAAATLADRNLTAGLRPHQDKPNIPAMAGPVDLREVSGHSCWRQRPPGDECGDLSGVRMSTVDCANEKPEKPELQGKVHGFHCDEQSNTLDRLFRNECKHM